MSNRPFFSIIIPCYNDGRYSNKDAYLNRALNSILENHLSSIPLEVIIADDCSPQPYDDIIDSFKDMLNIQVVKTDYNCCPGNTRQRGVEAATGEWICFLDHDDVFYAGALDIVKAVINKTHEQHVVYCDFNQLSGDDLSKVTQTFRFTKGNLDTWVHGKFYNKDNFWDPFHLHFIKDLKTHEDVALGNLVKTALVRMNWSPTYIQKPLYAWIENADSISHSKYVDTKLGGVTYSFLETHFKDYVTSQVDIFLDAYDNRMLRRDDAIIQTLVGIASCYSCICTFRSQHKKKYLRSPEGYVSKEWATIKSKLGMTVTAAKVIFATQLSHIADDINKIASSANLPSIIEWLAYIDTVDYAELIKQDSLVAISQATNDTLVPSSRPFFSVIIPCYNDGRYKPGSYLDRLLASLTRQGLHRDELEVILSDDCSPVPFAEIIDKYCNQLYIKYIKTDYNFAPGNTRAKGLTIATGQWLCFADHDDIYYDNALLTVKTAIEGKKEQHFIFGDFNSVSAETGEITHSFVQDLNWCHAKFYNKDNFWDKYNLHFIPDLKSHEDIAICTQVSCIFASKVKEYSYIHTPLYAWTDNPQSISHAKYTVDTESGSREFLEVFFSDYLEATGYIYLDQFSSHVIRMVDCINFCLGVICYCYFYTQGFQFRNPTGFRQENLTLCGRYIDQCKQKLNLTNKKIYDVVASNHAFMYYKIQNLASNASGHYIPTQTFKQWLDLVSSDK